ncbi:MAG: iron-containing alcohol dehydrogenase, partial [Rhodospirillales bacterium]|nr:iron-containing alcohol dehydrogenase [Rhodospirillales bacterium]
TAIGLAKLIALELDIPLITVVTTYSGSETGEGQGMLVGNRRVAHRSPRMLPKTIIYDSDLTRGLPVRVAVPSGINAMAHAVGAFYTLNANPLSSLVAEDGIRALASALPRIADGSADGDVLDLALYGAWLCGIARTTAGLVLHHNVCHMAGNSFDLPHSDTHTIILPHSTAFYREAAPEAMSRIARALGDESGDAPGAIYDLLLRIGAPTALKDIGMPEEGLDPLVELILADYYPNPVPIKPEAVRAMLDDAWHGRPPRKSG